MSADPILGARAARRPAVRRRRALPAKLAVIALLGASAGGAQVAPRWTPHTVLAETKTAWSRPTITADARGHVHVLWADRAEAAAPGQDAKGDGLYHRSWDGQQWSAPVRVFAKDSNMFCVIFPDATVGNDDELYVVWSEQGSLYFNHAPAETAHDPDAWSSATRVVQASMIDQSRIVRDTKGRLHVVYTRLASDDGPGGNVFSVFSDDDGQTWSTPQQVSRVPTDAQIVVATPRLVLDRTGALHTVWSEPHAPNWISWRVLYARSDDGGHTWSEPLPLAAPPNDTNNNVGPSLVSTGRNTLHFVWGCIGPPKRCYRTSVDGGRTWSPTALAFDRYVSMAGWDALVADANANLDLVAQLRMPYGMYHAFKPAGLAWQAPVRFVGEKGFEDGHFVSAVAVGTGVHAVWQKGPGTGDVVYAYMTLAAGDAATAPADPTPAATPP